jgi:hypothetical protein
MPKPGEMSRRMERALVKARMASVRAGAERENWALELWVLEFAVLVLVEFPFKVEVDEEGCGLLSCTIAQMRGMMAAVRNMAALKRNMCACELFEQ